MPNNLNNLRKKPKMGKKNLKAHAYETGDKGFDGLLVFRDALTACPNQRPNRQKKSLPTIGRPLTTCYGIFRLPDQFGISSFGRARL
jgi:hypothetical protein